ncbi:unnamed protein product [Paramecium primaurelia]|uniref:Sodium/calcium exchanger membrane region domain-containing protein n=1 Tax=Paramecium primaurelia TaxID=5886 RepID=A0A8S1PCB4_PARPR|nr:unnamed protein product [Paramecium primaurelia]
MYWHLTEAPYEPKNLSCQKSQFMQTSEHSQQCFIAQQYCQHDFLYFNYSILSYCWLNGSIMTTLIVSGFVGYQVYNGISEVIKEYLIPSLEAVKVRFEISEIMAGVTLLAFGNGAGDVLTALVASSYPGGIDYNIGATMGAGFFLCSIGVYLITKTSKSQIKMEPVHFWRNVGFQIISIFVIMVFGVIGQISYFSSISLTVLYLILVSLVYYQERDKILKSRKDSLGERVQTVNEAKYDLEIAQKFDDMKLLYFWDKKSEMELAAKPVKWATPLIRLNYVSGDARVKMLAKKFRSAVKLTMANIETQKQKWDRLSMHEKVRAIIIYPLQMILKFTLPKPQEDQFDKNQAIIFPIPGSVFFVSVVFSFPPWWVYFLALMCGFGISIFINTTTPSQRTPPNYFFYIQLYCILGSLVWIFFLSGLLIDFLQFWAIITELNKTFLGFSLIAMGNVLPDCITLVQLAEQGYAIMALNGIYFGQMFTNLIGFSVAFLKQNFVNSGPIKFNLFSIIDIEQNAFKLMVILAAFLNLLFTLIMVVRNHYIITKFIAKLLTIFYSIFFILSSSSAFYHAWVKK